MIPKLQKWCEECDCYTYDWTDDNGHKTCAVCGEER